ncbi:carotenoid phi-ring synthase-like [Antedon mediterranea]|uniref:carotenoid phi-ring synthase-like n=1 Tax=Antedon mediterranea TaxID=105859 RepID=UPI003AF83400
MRNRTICILAIVILWFSWVAFPRPPRVIKPVNPNDPTNLPDQVTKNVLVIGGGLAGLSAALELSERGFNVSIKEADTVVGGRLHTKDVKLLNQTWPIETGFHAWFNNYFQSHDILERLGVKSNFRRWEAVDYIFRDYEPESIYSKGPYPLNLFGLIHRSPNMKLTDALHSVKSLVDLAYFQYDTIFEKYANTTLEEWARDKDVPQSFYDILMKPILSVTLNRRDIFSAAEMLTYNQIYFLSDSSADHRIITTKNFQDAVIGPWTQLLLSYGVRIQLNTKVEQLVMNNDGSKFISTSSTPNEQFDHVIMAASLDSIQNILKSTEKQYHDNEQIRNKINCLLRKVGKLPMSPPYKVMRVWFDKQLQNKPEILETPHHHPINLIVQYNLLEETYAEWANRTGGSVLEFHLYTWSYGDVSDDRVWDLIRPTAEEIYPDIKDFKILAYHVHSANDFPSFEINTHQFRPTVTYPKECELPNLSFAGDWLYTDFPSALMERAVTTGRQAANHVLLSEGVRQSNIVSINLDGPGIV